MSNGILEVIVGCMSSGKSEELMRRLRRAKIGRQGVIVFKPKRDTRVGSEVASRDGNSMEAVPFETEGEILGKVTNEHQVVGIDEAQFFDAWVLATIQKLVERGKRVIVAGLDTDFNGKPFGIVPDLMAVADEVSKLNAVCMRCGRRATRTQFLSALTDISDGDNPIIVGGDGDYEARCRDCHTVPSFG